MEAMELDWMAKSLKGCCLSVISDNFIKFENATSTLPVSLQFAVFHQLYLDGKLDLLAKVFSNLEIFSRMLTVKKRRLDLHRSFQAIRDEGIKISEVIAESYSKQASDIQQSSLDDDENDFDSTISRGFHLGGFFLEAGWNEDASRVLSACIVLCLHNHCFLKAFHCVTKLLHTYNADCLYKETEQMFSTAQEIFQSLRLFMPDVELNLASLFMEYGAYHFAKSEYDKAYRWSIEAVRMLKQPGYVSETTMIDVLRLATRACVVKRQFKAAEHLVRHAVYLAREVFGALHPKYSSTLMDYGFYLLNVDNVSQSLKAYQTALAIREHVFGGQNLHVAVAHEDLAYASYVHQYSTGKFDEALSHADKAIKILTKILPKNHLLLASSNRVKALILEEIAIDSEDQHFQKKLLAESHQLHLKSMELAMNAFGENNVQTAKHFGNLGRLYQSMELYEKAEEMHLKAIAIKEELLGPNDYEVALSIGHIASLYNYDMKQYEKAERLYLRSIAISKQLYGDGYSGLEYDYRGLIKIYAKLGDFEKMIEYDYILSQWYSIREQRRSTALNGLYDLIADTDQEQAQNTRVIIDTFFETITSDTDKSPQNVIQNRTRTSHDIAFAGPVHEQACADRRQSGNNPHEINANHAASSNSMPSSINVDSYESFFPDDDEISVALKKFHVMPLKIKSFKRRKIKSE